MWAGPFLCFTGTSQTTFTWHGQYATTPSVLFCIFSITLPWAEGTESSHCVRNVGGMVCLGDASQQGPTSFLPHISSAFSCISYLINHFLLTTIRNFKKPLWFTKGELTGLFDLKRFRVLVCGIALYLWSLITGTIEDVEKLQMENWERPSSNLHHRHFCICFCQGGSRSADFLRWVEKVERGVGRGLLYL